jgi:peptidoglycan hydrolase CwlO-like protein
MPLAMNAAQIDQTLEKLVLELQNFKRSSDLLSDVGTKTEEVIEAAEAIISMADQMHSYNQSQLEALKNYTDTSQRSLATIVTRIDDAQAKQYELLANFEKTFQEEIQSLAKAVDVVQRRQEDTAAKLARSIAELRQEQSRIEQRDMWFLFVILLIALIGTGVSLWMIVVSSGIV